MDINEHFDHFVGEYEGGDNKADYKSDSTKNAGETKLNEGEKTLHHDYPKETIPVKGIHKTGHLKGCGSHTNDEITNDTIVEEEGNRGEKSIRKNCTTDKPGHIKGLVKSVK